MPSDQMTTSRTSSPAPSKPKSSFSSFQRDPHYHAAVAHAARVKCIQLIRSGWLRPARPRPQSCRGEWKPRMDLIDDPSSPNILALFELPGVKNDSITLQIKDARLVVFGNRADPFAAALATATAGASSSESTSGKVNTAKVDSNATNTTTGSLETSNNSIHELRYGSFYRTISVPDGIKQTEVTAGLQDGMLTVSWPRVPAAAQRPTASPATRENSMVNRGIATLNPGEATTAVL